MDAARGQAHSLDAQRWPLWDDDDIPDPHTSGFDLHAAAVECVLGSASQLAQTIAVVLDSPEIAGAR